MRKIKTFFRATTVALFLTLFFLPPLPTNGADAAPTNKVSTVAKAEPEITPAQAESPFAKGTWTVSSFATYRAHELGEFNGELGAGARFAYAPADNIEIELETVSDSIDSADWLSSFTEAGVNLKGYLPVGKSGFAPYGFIGYTREIAADNNRMNAGAGIAWRYKQVGLFADGRWTHDFRQLGHALFCAGGSVSF